MRTLTLQVADATKPLASAGRSTSKGHTIVLDGVDAHILHKDSDKRIRLHKKGNLLVMRTAVLPPTKTNDAKNDEQLLGDLGFTWQEDD